MADKDEFMDKSHAVLWKSAYNGHIQRVPEIFSHADQPAVRDSPIGVSFDYDSISIGAQFGTANKPAQPGEYEHQYVDV